MPSLRHITLSLIIATLFSAPAAAQWFSDRPAKCPVGTVLSRSGKCVKSSRSSSRSASTSLPRSAPKARKASRRPRVVPPAKPPRGTCPKGAYAISTKGGFLCVPITDTGGDTLKACSSFNSSFSGWYRAEVAEYESLAKRNRDNEAAMKRHIDRQKSVERDLQRQVFRARQTGVRRELTAQLSNVRRDIRSNRSHLKASRKGNRAKETEWKKAFKERLKQKLQARPAGCKVGVAN